MSILGIKVLVIILCISALATTSGHASVSRQVSFEMHSLDDFQLTKSRTYTDNETSMIRTQIDKGFGNDDGFLNQSEVNAFKTTQDYYEQSPWIKIDNSGIIKPDMEIQSPNLTGSVNDTSAVVTITYIFEAEPATALQGREHYIKFSQELWKYVDMERKGQFTKDNNLTIIAPEDWQIVYTSGLQNETYSENLSVLEANANLDFDWVTIKISKGAGDNDGLPNPGDGSDDSGMLLLAVLIGAVITVLVIATVMRAPQKQEVVLDDEVPPPPEMFELVAEKEQLRGEILKVRRELRNETITKDEAGARENALKERIKEIDKSLRSMKTDEKID